MADEIKDPFGRIKDSDSKGEDSTEEGKEKEKSIRLRWVIIFILAIVLGVCAFFLTEYVLIPQYHYYQQTKRENGDSFEKKNGKMGFTYAMDDLTVNTYKSDGRRFVVAAFIIESDAERVIEEVKNREPQIRDELIKYLRHHTAQQILDQSFQDKSKTELMDAINERLDSGDITSLYYTKLVLQ